MNCRDEVLQSAGYDPNGNDRKGHFHPCDNGRMVRADLVRGHYCLSPTYMDRGIMKCEQPYPCKGVKEKVEEISEEIWIDTKTGTWGDPKDMVIVNLQDVVDVDGEETDVYSYLAALDSMTDSERNEFGNTWGKKYEDVVEDAYRSMF